MKADTSVVQELMQASSEGNVQKLEEIIQAGVPVDVVDNNGRTALHMASTKGNKEAVIWLLRHGANVNAIDAFGNSPLQDSQRGESKTKREIFKVSFSSHPSLSLHSLLGSSSSSLVPWTRT